jgi:hypothetical protein
MGGTLYGNWFRQVILTSIALSQIGFVCGKSHCSPYVVKFLLIVFPVFSLYHLRCREPASLRPWSDQVQATYPD